MGGVWSFDTLAPPDNFARLLPSSRVERSFRFVLTGFEPVDVVAASASAAGVSRGVSVGVGSAVGSSGAGGALGVVDPETGVDVELRLTLARLCVDQRPCIERLRAFELCLETCEGTRGQLRNWGTHRDLH